MKFKKKFIKTRTYLWIMIVALLTMLWLLIFGGNMSKENLSLTEDITSETETNTTTLEPENETSYTTWETESGTETATDEPIEDETELIENLTSDEGTTKWKEIIKNFFEYGNKWDYLKACNLLTKDKCFSTDWKNLWLFSRFWTKLDGWYTILSVEKAKEQPTADETIYCVKYEYKLKDDLSPDKIKETFQYRLIKTEDWTEKIKSRVCEEITKWWKNIKCSVITPKFYCK